MVRLPALPGRTTRAERWAASNPGNRAARAELLEAIAEATNAQLEGEGALLDCGCGTGWLLEALAAAGIEPRRLRGVDSDPGRVAAASRRVPGAQVVVADARRLPYADDSFDAVFHLVSLSSMGPPESMREVLAETRRVLAHGGVLLVYEPRLPNPGNRRTRLVGAADLSEAGLPISEARSLTLLPPLGRRLGRLTPTLYPLLSRLRPLRTHRLLVHRAPAATRAPVARGSAPRR